MQHRSLGCLDVSVVGLGTNNFGLPRHGLPPVGTVVCDQARTTAIVHAALDAGITFIDTADEYALGEAETFIGVALGARRDEAVLATKCASHHSPTPGSGAGRDRIIRSVEASLQRLGTDRIDLLQLHFPDPTTPIDETLAAFDHLVASGKVREIGCCNFTADQLDAAAGAARDHDLRPFASAQNPYSVLGRRAAKDLLPALDRHGMRLIPYWPLAGGLLTGKYRRGHTPPPDSRMAAQPVTDQDHLLAAHVFDRVEALERFAADHGHTLLELAFSWLVAQDVVASVIAGATSERQVQANAAAAGWQLSGDQRSELDQVLERPR